MASNTILVRVLGNTKSLSRSLDKARKELGGLEQINRSLGRGFRVAAIGAAIFAASAVGAGAAGAAALAAIPLGLAGIGIAFAAQSKEVKKAFKGLKTYVLNEGKDLAKPLIEPLLNFAQDAKRAFDALSPSLRSIFKDTAPLINQFGNQLVPIAKKIGPIFEQAFAAGVPVLKEFGRAIKGPILDGIGNLFKELGKGTPQFKEFVRVLGDSIGQLLPAIGRLLTALAPIGTAILQTLIPALVELTDWISREVGPAFNKLTGFIGDHPTAFKRLGIAILGFVGALKTAQVAMAAFSGAASLISTVTQIGNAFVGAGRKAASFAGGMRNMGGAARILGGAAGLGLIVDAGNRTSKVMGGLEGAIGGALSGAMVGGPWGAAIGGLAGGLIGVANASGQAGRSFDSTRVAGQKLAGTFDQLTGKATQYTRRSIGQHILAEQPNIVRALDATGLSLRDYIDVVMNVPGAQKRMNAALREGGNAWIKYKNGGAATAKSIIENTLPRLQDQYENTAKKQRELAQASFTWKKALQGLPKQAVTRVRTIGTDITTKQIANLKKQYHLTPKQVRTIVKATGIDLTRKQAERLGVEFKKLPQDARTASNGMTKNFRPNVKPGMDKAKSDTRAGWNDIFGIIKSSGAKASASAKGSGHNAAMGWKAGISLIPGITRQNMGQLSGAISSSNAPSAMAGVASRVRANASVDLSGPGANASASFAAGLRSSLGAAESAAAQLAAIAQRAVEAKLKIASPSKVFRRIGQFITKGLIKGLHDGRSGVKSTMQKIADEITKVMNDRFKSSKVASKAAKAAINSLDNETKRLMKNAKVREAVYKRMQKAQEKLNAAIKKQKDYAASVKNAIIDFGNITSFEVPEGGVTTGGILEQLRARVDAAKRYESLLLRLRKMGLNKTTFNQLIQAGAEGGLDTAQALLTGGTKAVKEVNNLTGQLTNTAKDLGEKTAKEMYGAGTKAARGLVEGIRKRVHQVERVARHLAHVLAKAVKKALRVHSPSKIFEDIGVNVTRGLEIGIRDVKGIKRGAVKMADALKDGFEMPRLEASAVGGGSAGGNVTIQVIVPPTADQASIGREIQKSLDAYYRSGGRRSA